MIILPITCEWLFFLIASTIFFGGMYLMIDNDFDSSSWAIAGFVMSGVTAVLGILAGVIIITEWCEKNVRCKCKK